MRSAGNSSSGAKWLAKAKGSPSCAASCALKVLAEAARELSLDFPRASVSVGPNRGIRVTWSRGHGEVRLICGGSVANKSYIFSESGSQHGVEYIIDGKHLAQHLRWALREA